MGKGDLVKAAIPAAFILFFIVAVALAVFVFTEEEEFDHYRTDVDIVVNDDGTVKQTETYWFSWNNVSSGEMYLTFPSEKWNRIKAGSIEVWVDGVPAVEALTYEEGRNASYSGVGLPMFFYGYNSASWDYEINAFYARASSGDHEVTFSYELKYTEYGAVKRYADCVDFYYKVYTNFSYDLKNLTVNVKMPLGYDKTKARIYGHGDPNGYSEFTDEGAVFTSSLHAAYTMYEIRVVTEQTDIFVPTLDVIPGKTFASILAEEKKFYDDTQFAIKMKNVIITLMTVMFISSVLLAVFRKRLVRRKRPEFRERYVRDIPVLAPNIVSRFGGYYSPGGGAMKDKIAAAILQLTVKKAMKMEKGADGDIVFIPVNSDTRMNAFERAVYNMIFRNSSNPVTLASVKSSASHDYGLAGRLGSADSDGFDTGRYVQRKHGFNPLVLLPVFFVAVPALIVVLLVIMTAYFDALPFLLFETFLCAILCFYAKNVPPPLTVDGENEHAKAKALKRFYTDMTLMKEREAMELSLWELHLVYATALGVSGKVIKELGPRLVYPAAEGAWVPVYFNAFNTPDELVAGISSIRTISPGSYPSSSGGSGGSGGGGGFSGGGGGGFGGGGGGHR